MLPESVVHYTTEEKTVKPRESALAMLQRTERPTAFVCYNDELAVSLLDAARQAGLSVPEDLSIVGFDDSALATATNLTTLTHPKMEMGVQAVELLLSIIENKAFDTGKDIVFKPELVVRESTRKNINRNSGTCILVCTGFFLFL